MSSNAWTILGSVIVAIIAVAGSWIAAKTANKGQRDTARQTPYDQMEARLSKLEASDSEKAEEISKLKESNAKQEDRIRALETEAGILIAAIEELLEWHSEGAVPPPPVLSPEVLEIYRRHRESGEGIKQKRKRGTA